MKIHEYQAKDILARYGIPIQPGRVAYTSEEAAVIARELGGPVVVKAQVYVGGRGKAGGIQFGDTPEQAREAAARVLGMNLSTVKTQIGRALELLRAKTTDRLKPNEGRGAKHDTL